MREGQEGDPVTGDSLKRIIIAKLEEVLAALRQLEPRDHLETLIDLERLIWDKGLLSVEMAAEIRNCSGEWIRRQCETAYNEGDPIAFKIGKAWIIVTTRWLKWIERREGGNARSKVEAKLKEHFSAHSP